MVWPPLILLLALQAADVISTYVGISKGAHEANPVMAFFMTLLGDVPGMLVAKGIIVAAVLFLPVPQAMLWLLCLVYAWVIWNNVSVIRASK
jgi:Domain of unknown function (DUF5658)